MLDIDRIRQLVDMMVANELSEISLRDGDVEVSLRRPHTNSGAGAGADPLASGNPGTHRGESLDPASSPTDEEAAGELVEIRSPMVGTFYAAPDPESPPFVQGGSRVNPNTVVCIVEAMKVFNEIKAETSGTIERTLVQNEDAVEYGQPLFLVRLE